MWRQTRQLLEMIRFSHTLFALPFALLSAVMAWRTAPPLAPASEFRLRDLAGILLCMIAARTAAMTFNRIADRRLDALNPRTELRHLPRGEISTGAAAAFALAASIGFVLSTLLFLPNRLPLFLALPVLIFLLAYSYTKRFTSAAHFWLGAALMLAPVSAWIAIRGQHVLENPADLLPALVLGLAVLFWVAGFDVIYACQDVDFDRQSQLHSLPATIGVGPALRLAAASHAVMVVLLACLPLVYPQLGWVYRCGVVAIALLLIYEHRLVRPDDLARVNLAFFNVNIVVSLGLFAVGTLDLLI